MCQRRRGRRARLCAPGRRALEGETQWTTFTLAAPLTKQRGTAPFMAVRANGGSRIDEIGFDVMNVPGNTGSVRQVAIGPLFFTP